MPSSSSSSSSSPPAPPQPLILALSGLSCSGKTTIATHLHHIFPSSALLHLDDFYLPESALPFRAGFRDWDCPQSIDISALRDCLEGWKRGDGIAGEGERRTQGVMLVEGKNGEGEGEQGVALVETLRREVEGYVSYNGSSSVEGSEGVGDDEETGRRQIPALLILEGFLLFAPEMEALQRLFDIRILLRTPYAAAKARREAREGYTTLEGFWQDPPGYFEKVVWPSYVEGHEGLFEEGDVEGERKPGVAGVEVQPMGMGLGEGLEWVVGIVKRGVMGMGG